MVWVEMTMRFFSHGEIDGGEEIGEGFADAGAGFDEQMVFSVKRVFDGRGHLHLLWAIFVERPQSPRDRAVVSEDGIKRNRHSLTECSTVACRGLGQSVCWKNTQYRLWYSCRSGEPARICAGRGAENTAGWPGDDRGGILRWNGKPSRHLRRQM
jgi:hypothetical protein